MVINKSESVSLVSKFLIKMLFQNNLLLISNILKNEIEKENKCLIIKKSSKIILILDSKNNSILLRFCLAIFLTKIENYKI
jgi:hypothetical protein